jgi:hypothetical protein
MKNKKAQISVFIIIGIVIVVALSLFLYFATEQTEKKMEQYQLEDIPEEVQPIRSYITTCINDIGVKAIFELGKHGGYIDPEDAILTGKELKFDENNPTESDGISFFNTKVPYWLHMKSSNQCIECEYSKNIPSIQKIESQINQYIENKIDQCINSYSSFTKEGFQITEITTPHPKTMIREKDIIINMEFELTVEKNGRKTNMKKFTTQIPFALKETLQLAFDITKSFYTIQIPEELTMHLISIYSGMDTKEDLPPIAGTSRETKRKIWHITSTKQKVSEVISNHISLMNFANSLNNQPVVGESELNPLYPFNIGINTSQELIKKHEVKANYLDWPMYIDINPKEDDILIPSQEEYLGIQGYDFFEESPYGFEPYHLRIYNFYYDIAYPLIIELREPQAFNGEGYSFFFAHEVNIKENLNLKNYLAGSAKIPLILDKVNFERHFKETELEITPAELFPEGLIDNAYFTQTDDGTYPFNNEETLFCDKDQRITKEHIIFAKNAETKEDISEVDLFFGCGRYKQCKIHYTEFIESINKTAVIAKLPVCEGGHIFGRKKGYFGIPKFISTKANIGSNITINMEPIKTVKINIKTKDPKDIDTSQILATNKSINLVVSRLKGDDPFYRPFNQKAFFIGNGEENIQKIDLIPGEYMITARYIDPEGFVIKAGAEIIEIPGSDPISLPEEDQEFIPAQLGGTMIGEETITELHPKGSWTVTREDLAYAGNTIEFYALKFKKPSTFTEMTESAKVEEYSQLFRDKLEPAYYYDFNTEES